MAKNQCSTIFSSPKPTAFARVPHFFTASALMTGCRITVTKVASSNALCRNRAFIRFGGDFSTKNVEFGVAKYGDHDERSRRPASGYAAESRSVR